MNNPKKLHFYYSRSLLLILVCSLLDSSLIARSRRGGRSGRSRSAMKSSSRSTSARTRSRGRSRNRTISASRTRTTSSGGLTGSTRTASAGGRRSGTRTAGTARTGRRTGTRTTATGRGRRAGTRVRGTGRRATTGTAGRDGRTQRVAGRGRRRAARPARRRGRRAGRRTGIRRAPRRWARTRRRIARTRPPRFVGRIGRLHRWDRSSALGLGLLLGSSGYVFGLGLGYSPYNYFWDPFDPFWGDYYYHPLGAWYYPKHGFWYHPNYHSWYYPWFNSWFFPNYNAWYYPRFGISIVSHLNTDEPYVIVDNDAEKDLYYAIYEKEGDDKKFMLYQLDRPRAIDSNRSIKLSLPPYQANTFMVIGAEDKLKQTLSDEDIQAFNLTSIDLSHGEEKNKTNESIEEEEISPDEYNELDAFKKEIQEKDTDLVKIGENIREEIEEEKEYQDTGE